MKFSAGLLTLLLLTTLPACAQHKHVHDKPVKSGSTAIRFLDATLQTTRPGAPGQQPFSNWKFIAVWNSATPPTTFFWRPEGDRWMTCAVSRVHGFISQDKTPFYKKELIDLKDIRRGDIIEIVPQPGGRDVMPPAVKSKPVNFLYFQRARSKAWETANPGTIHRVTDIIMP